MSGAASQNYGFVWDLIRTFGVDDADTALFAQVKGLRDSGILGDVDLNPTRTRFMIAGSAAGPVIAGSVTSEGLGSSPTSQIVWLG